VGEELNQTRNHIVISGSAHAKSTISAHIAEFIFNLAQMDCWCVAMLGDGCVGKTALAVHVSLVDISDIGTS
jgi:hypothetical protein